MRGREQFLAVALAWLLAVSAAAPAVGAATPDAGDAVEADGGLQPTADLQSADAGGGTAASQPDRSTADRGGAVVHPALDDASGSTEVVVRLDEAAPGAARTAGDRASRAETLASHARESQAPVVEFAERTDGVDLVNRFWLSNAVVLEVDRDAVDLGAIAALDGVRAVHPNFEVQVPEPAEPNGSASASDATATDAGPDTTYGLDQINATEVWDAYGTQGGGVKVAVLDTGVDASHPDVDLYTENASNESYPGGWAEFDGDGERVAGSTPHDTDDHGTHTSGTVAGGNASGEYVGVASNADLLHGLVLPGGSGTFAQIVAGMEWAVQQDADIISMSLGADGYNARFIEPVRNAHAAGTLVVAAAGNSYAGSSGSPGNVYDSFAVGASNDALGIAQFSSGEVVDTGEDWGLAAPEDWPDSYVVPDVAAPGVAVKSTEPGGGYQQLSGTSMATPHVAGALALTLSAADRNVSVAELRSAYRQTAFKPADCQPDCTPRDGNDTRYGAGIVDAATATVRLAADQGVAGTVTGVDGDPVAGATVELDTGFVTRTGEDGSYELRTRPGERSVAVRAFGYENASTTANVTDGEFAAGDVALDPELAAEVMSAQPAAAEGGEAVTTTVRVAHADQYTVDLAGDYDAADATLYVDGEEASFDEPVTFESPRTGEVTVTVETTADTTGDLSLHHQVEGLGETVALTTGPTDVYADEVPVAVVDTVDGGYGDDTATALRDSLPGRYNVSLVAAGDVLGVVDEYEVFVVQNVSRSPSLVREFVDATAGPDTGVVWLDQWGPNSNAIRERVEATGEPTQFEEKAFGVGTPYFELLADHPIFEGVGGAGDTVPIHTGDFGDHTWFHGFDGRVLADVGDDTGVAGSGIGVDALDRTVLASSLGRTGQYLVDNDAYTEAADRILANAVEYANATPPVALQSGQPTRVSPGEDVEVTLDAADLDAVEVELTGDSTLAAEDLTLSVAGEPAAFGENVSVEPPADGTVTITVGTDDDAVGSVALEHTFVVDGETTTARTGATAVYDPPLEVPSDVDSLGAAVDLAPYGAEVVVADGTYEEQVTVRTPNVTVHAADGARPTLAAPAGADGPVVHVVGNGATLAGFDVDAGGGDGVFVDDAMHVTVRDLTVEGAATGVLVDGSRQLAFGAEDAHVANVTVEDADTGVAVQFLSEDGLVENSTVVDADTGVVLGFLSDRSAVRNTTVTDVDTGVTVESLTDDTRVAGTAVTNATTGVYLAGDGATVRNNSLSDVGTGVESDQYTDVGGVVGNDVTNATTGVRLGYSFSTSTVTANDIAADTGIEVEDAKPVLRYNDLSATGTAVENTAGGAVDARLNYYAPRGPANASVTFDGPVGYDPFLTEPVESADAGAPTAIGTDLQLAAGEEYALGVPGPSGQSIHDVLGEEFAGDVYRYGSNAGKWLPVNGNGRHAQVEALDAFRVAPETDTRAVVTFRPSTADPPSPPAASPGEASLDEGWNFVAAPRYGDAGTAFGAATADLVEVRPTLDGVDTPGNPGGPGGPGGEVDLQGPAGQLGPASDLNDSYEFGDDAPAPAVSAFRGYFVYADDGGSLPANVSASPTMSELLDDLGLAPGGSSAGVATASVGDAADPDSLRTAVRDAPAADRTALVEAVRDAVDGEADLAASSVERAVRRAPAATVATALDGASATEQAAILDAVRAVLDGRTAADGPARNASGTAPDAVGRPPTAGLP